MSSNTIALPMGVVAEHKFQVNLGGIISLLSKNLYSSPGVYLRELIQNAIDAIVARDEITGEAAPRYIIISPYGVNSPNSPADELAVADAGIGLTLNQVEEFLATVGSSSKSGELAQNRHSFIGQFGIGLLSCFLVSDEVKVTSQSAMGGPPIEWVGRSDGTYTVRTLNEPVAVGTTVRLRPRPDMISWARPETVSGQAKRYAEFLPADIQILTKDGAKGISRPFIDYGGFQAHRSEILGGRSPKYSGYGHGAQFDVIEVDDAELGLHALIYIKLANRGHNNHNLVYVNGMLVDSRDTRVLPSWASFAWAVVQSTKLEPTASRESVMDNPDLVRTTDRLGRAVLDWLGNLAATDPDRFNKFIADNHMELARTIATGSGHENLELARVALPLLPFETTEGKLRLMEIVERSAEILFTRSTDDFRTLASFGTGGQIIVNGGYAYAQELLQLAPQVIEGVTVAPTHPASFINEMMEPPAMDSDAVASLASKSEKALGERVLHVSVRMLPNQLPAVIVKKPDYWKPILMLNWGNQVIRKLADLQDNLVFIRIIQLLFVQARMAAQVNDPNDRTLLSEALDDIIALAVGAGELGGLI